MDPRGVDCWMLELLQLGHLALVLGDALFLHGGLHEEALGKVPEAEPAEDMQEWARRLNAWKEPT